MHFYLSVSPSVYSPKWKWAQRVRRMDALTMPQPSIILFGPVRTGKSTLAIKLASDLGIPRQSLDDLRWSYYREVAFDSAYSDSLEQTGRWNERRLYWSKHDPHAIRRVL